MPMSELEKATRKLRVAAAGDIHCREATRDRVIEAFARLDGEADLALLAGDLTSHGTVAEAEIVCAAAAASSSSRIVLRSSLMSPALPRAGTR